MNWTNIRRAEMWRVGNRYYVRVLERSVQWSVQEKARRVSHDVYRTLEILLKRGENFYSRNGVNYSTRAL